MNRGTLMEKLVFAWVMSTTIALLCASMFLLQIGVRFGTGEWAYRRGTQRLRKWQEVHREQERSRRFYYGIKQSLSSWGRRVQTSVDTIESATIWVTTATSASILEIELDPACEEPGRGDAACVEEP